MDYIGTLHFVLIWNFIQCRFQNEKFNEMSNGSNRKNLVYAMNEYV